MQLCVWSESSGVPPIESAAYTLIVYSAHWSEEAFDGLPNTDNILFDLLCECHYLQHREGTMSGLASVF